MAPTKCVGGQWANMKGRVTASGVGMPVGDYGPPYMGSGARG
jgi:hypothetical protein